MRYSVILAMLFCVPFLTACNNQPAPATAEMKSEKPSAAETGDTSKSTSEESHQSPLQTEEASAAATKAEVVESEMEYGEWLRLPEGVDSRLTAVYPTLVKSSMGGDQNGLTNLSIISQQLAMMLAKEGKVDDANQFLIQSGKAMREGVSGGSSPVNSSTIAMVFFNEACALSKTSKLTEAMAALNDAMSNGFSDLSKVLSDDDLATVRGAEGFAAKFEEWQKSIAQRMAELAQKDLATAETFPFTFSAKDINGHDQSLDALLGKVVIVDVWGTWCPPCRAEIPSFIKLQEEFGPQGLQMIGLNYERGTTEEQNLAAVIEFVKDTGINYPCIMGENSVRAQIPQFQGYPTTLFIDKTGRVRLKAVGLHDYAYLEAIVAQLLSET